MIRTLALRQNGKMVRISRDVRLIGRRDFYFMGTVEITAIENTVYQGTTFEYEVLD
jgi:pectin methylesterase-like acyl-CoA thioesterase